MSEIVSIKIKIEDNGTIKNVTVNAKELDKVIEHVTKSAKDFNRSLVNWSQAANATETLNSAIGGLRDKFAELAQGFNDDQVGLAKLTTAMRNTMGASDDMVASVEGLIDAQERLGVIEKDAQLAGAQELATYLQLSDSLKTLIPVMNDMAAQQIGIGASGESVAQIAAMLGKVMEGQTEALSRYGYKFNEVQKEILKFGTESERAAVLADVVTSSVGGMNEALRDTDAGRLFEVKVAFDGIKDALGIVAVKVLPFINGLSELGQGAAGLFQLYSSFNAVSEALNDTTIKTIALSAHQKVQAAAQRLLAASGYTAAAGTTALKIATIGLYAAMTMGLSFVISGIISLISSLGNKAEDAAGGVESLDEAADAYSRTASDMRAALAMETVSLEKLIKSKGDETAKVSELNQKYGEAFGYHQTAAEWYDILKSKSAAYCQQLGYEAQAKVLASQKAAKELELEEIRRKKASMKGNETENGFYIARDSEGKAAGWGAGEHYTKEYQDLLVQERELYAETEMLGKAFQDCMNKAADAGKEMAQAVPTAGKGKGGSVVKDLTDDIASYVQSVNRAVEVNQAFNSGKDDEEVRLEAMKSGITSLISKYGSESTVIQKLIDDYYALKSARTMAMMANSSIAEPLEKLAPITGKATTSDRGPIRPNSQTSTTDISVTGVDSVNAATESLGTLSDVMRNLSGVVGEGAASWISWGANLLSAIGQAIPAIMGLVAAKQTEATANTAAMATGAGSSVASIPYVGPAMAVAAIASVLAAVASLPKFASGGIAYGPTLGLFGEYAGAGHNPEVVAPLDRLRSILGLDGDGRRRPVEFKIKGRYMVALDDSERRRNRRG